jgi:hypothetical protein
MLALKTGIITSVIALAVSLPSMPRQFAYIGWSMTRRTCIDLLVLSNAGRYCRRKELCHAQELQHRWQQGDDRHRHDEHSWIVHLLLPYHRYNTILILGLFGLKEFWRENGEIPPKFLQSKGDLKDFNACCYSRRQMEYRLYVSC